MLCFWPSHFQKGVDALVEKMTCDVDSQASCSEDEKRKKEALARVKTLRKEMEQKNQRILDEFFANQATRKQQENTVQNQISSTKSTTWSILSQ